MAHYAFINSENIVVEVIVGRDEDDLIEGVDSWETYYATLRPGLICRRTSYNTYRDENGESKHHGDKVPFRGQFAGIGDLWDGEQFTTPNGARQ